MCVLDFEKQRGIYLIVVNGTEKCDGIITRYRKTRNRIEKSVLDFFEVCRRMFELILSMKIDEERNLTLTKYSMKNGDRVKIESDHNPLWCKINVSWTSHIKKDRKECLNLRSKDNQAEFKKLVNPNLMNCLTNSNDVMSGGRKWFKEVQNSLKSCFQKIRLTNKENSSKIEEELLKQISIIKKELNLLEKKKVEIGVIEMKKRLTCLESEISSFNYEKRKDIILNHINQLSDESNNLNNLKMWKLKQKVCPKLTEKPSAKRNK